MKYLILVATLLFTSVTFAQQGNSTEQAAVMMKMASFRSALLARDSASMSTLLADEVSYGHTNGLVQTKLQLIRDLVSGVQNYKSIEPSGMNVRVYGNSAVVTVKSKVS